MKPIFTSGLIKRLSFEARRPLHIFLQQQKLICFTKEAEEILNLSSFARLLGCSSAGSYKTGHEKIPVLSPKETDPGLVTLANHSSIRYPSPFLLLVLRSSKPASVSFTRWLIREVLPNIAITSKPLKLVTNDFELKKLLGRHENKMPGQVLIDLGVVVTASGNRRLKFDDDSKQNKGGE